MNKYLLLPLSVLLMFCACSTDLGGSISDVDLEIAYMYGYIVDQKGAAKENVEVVVFSPDSSINETGSFGRAVDTYYTELDGKYQFDSLGNGTYTILANFEDSLFADNLNINHDSVTFVGTDTLKEPGAIKGSVVLDDNNNMGVLVYIPGTAYIAVSDSLGEFLITDIPADSSYKLVFQYYGYAVVQFSEITVHSSDTLNLSPVILSKNQYPVGLEACIDTASNAVTVTWNKMHNDDIVGYVIYRKDSSQTALFPQQINTIDIVTDTFFIDILNEELFSENDTITFQYQIKAKNKKEDLSPFSDLVYVNAVSKADSLTEKTVSIISPSSSDTLLGAETYRLRWNFTGLIDSVELTFTPNNGASWFSIESQIENKGSFSWKVPNIESELCRYRIRDISSGIMYDESDIFTIKSVDNSNIIKNGDFAQGVAYWYISNHEGAISNLSTKDGEGIVTIDSGATEYWHIQYAQTGISIMQGYIYRVKFDARTTENPRTISASIGMGADPWITYSVEEFDITEEMSSFSAELAMPYPDDFNALFVFALGGDSNDLIIDNVSLEIVQ